MYVEGFDGKQHKFNFAKNFFRKNRKSKSSYHIKAREVIKSVFPSRSLYEEVTLPGSKKPGRNNLLYADFYIPDLSLIIEVHGEQHFTYSSFFYKTKMDFFNAQKRDRDKEEWCQKNQMKLIVLRYDQQEMWTSILSSMATNP